MQDKAHIAAHKIIGHLRVVRAVSLAYFQFKDFYNDIEITIKGSFYSDRFRKP